MSKGIPCDDRTVHRAHWQVTVRQANYSAFNGGRRTPSAYSQVWCPLCHHTWRTNAAYVATVPDQPGGAR